MTFEEYEAEVFRLYVKHGRELRWGQLYFNVLWVVRPDLAEKVDGTEIDPFYMDNHIAAFLDYLRRNW